MHCPSCHAENEDAVDTCFTCGAVLRASPATIKRGSVIASRYEVLSPLGRGGMGMVFKAHDRVLDEVVAVKTLRSDAAGQPEIARRFRSETRLARKVRHKNVCAIHGYGEEAGLRYIAMEFIEGVDLRRVLREKGRLPPKEAFDTVISVAQGLQAIHKAGVIHRDLKTANIMIDRHGVVRVMDFGVAKQSGAETTSAGAVIGTPEYMSPEQGRGQPVDFRCDIYALGVVIYEVFTGVVPFRGDTPIAIILKHLNDPPPLEGLVASGVPAPVVPILARALAKDPADRYQAPHDLLEALEEARFECYPQEAPAPRRIRGTAAPPPRIEGCVVVDDEPRLTPVPAAPATSLTPVEATLAERETAAMVSTPPEVGPRGARILAARPARVALATIVVAAVVVPLALYLRPRAPVETFHGSTAAESSAPQGVAAPPASLLPAPQAPAPAASLHAPPLATVPTRAASTPPRSTPRVPPIMPSAAPDDGRGPKGRDAAERAVDDAPPRAIEPQAEPAVSPVPAPPRATPAPPLVRRGELVEPGPGVQPPVLVSMPPPDYPMLARRMGREGRVLVRVLVDETGKVLDAAVVHSDRSNVAFDAAALESARKGVFKAPLKYGMPVRMWYEIPVDFRLK
jgi:TonB family protein